MDETLQQRLTIELENKKEKLAKKLSLLPKSKEAYMQTAIDERMRWAYEILHDFINKKANGERAAIFEQVADDSDVLTRIHLAITDNAPYLTTVAGIYVSVEQKDTSLNLSTDNVKVGIIYFDPKLDDYGNPSRFSKHTPKAIMNIDNSSRTYPLELSDSTTGSVVELVDDVTGGIIESQLARLAKLGKSVDTIAQLS